jgi:hypothetical protein
MDDARAVVSNYSSLHLDAQRILVNMAYNLGRTRLAGFKRMIDALEREDYQYVPPHMLNLNEDKWYILLTITDSIVEFRISNSAFLELFLLHG